MCSTALHLLQNILFIFSDFKKIEISSSDWIRLSPLQPLVKLVLMDQWRMLWFTEIDGIVHVIFEIHGQMTIEMATLLTHIHLIVIVGGAARLIGLCWTVGFVRLHAAFAAEPVPCVGYLILWSTTKSKYWNQLMVAGGKSSIRLIELTMAYNHLKRDEKRPCREEEEENDYYSGEQRVCVRVWQVFLHNSD